MQRRQFIKLASATGLAVVAPWHGRAGADEAPLDAPTRSTPGPLFVLVSAVGGWDPLLVCDPKLQFGRGYTAADIRNAADISYVNVPIANAQTFFDTYAEDMLVINGIDVATNSHRTGISHMATGLLGEGYPNVAALAAGHHGPQLPLAFLRFGPTNHSTAGVVAPTRGEGLQLDRLAHPERFDVADPTATYHSDYTASVIRAARGERAAAVQRSQQLPRYQGAVSTMVAARLGATQLELLERTLPATLSADPDRRSVQLVVAAHKAGIGVSASLATAGFDTHNNHDVAHRTAIAKLYVLLTALWEEAEVQGLADDLVVGVVSDFGRTPLYNANNGTDHWPISSAIIMKRGLGGRVVGATDEDQRAVEIDPDTLAPADAGAGGTKITPGHVHRALRKLAGMEGSELDARFPLFSASELDLLR